MNVIMPIVFTQRNACFLFFAAGHHNYSRYGLYFVRSMSMCWKDSLRDRDQCITWMVYRMMVFHLINIWKAHELGRGKAQVGL